jgi:hypothetical protein
MADLASGTVPSLRSIRARMHVGQERPSAREAPGVRDRPRGGHLTGRTESESGALCLVQGSV